MRLLAEELAVLTSPHKILSIGHCGGPLETSPVYFSHQRSCSYVVAANTLMYLPEYVVAVFFRDALHENA
jgi:hypothetical protein